MVPKVSIIVPVFGVQDYLHMCLDSILAQSLKDFELILINDGSPDHCGEICDAYAKIDNRIKVIHKKNEGVSIARNTGIDESNGEYIMFADPDDYVESNWCEVLLKGLKKNTQSLVVSGYNTHNQRIGNYKKSKNGCGNEPYLKLKKKEFYTLYENYLLNTLWNKIFISKIIKENHVRFNSDLSLGEDLLFNLDYLKYIEGDIILVNKYVYNYFLRDRYSLDNKYYKNLFEIYKLLYSEIEKCMVVFDTDILKIRENFSNSYLEMLHRVLDNTFHESSELSFLEKIKYNNMIIKSDEFKKAFEKANLNGFDSKYITVLKFENYLWIYLLKKFSIYKRKILRSK